MDNQGNVPDPIKSLTWLFKESNFLRVYVIGAFLIAIPIISLMPVGYSLMVMRDLLHGEPRQLRDWDELWRESFLLGLKAVGLAIVYILFAVAINFVLATILQAKTLGIFVAILALVVIYIVFPLIIARMLLADSFAAGLEVRKILSDLQRAGSTYYITHALTIGAFFLLSIIGGIPVLGLPFYILSSFALFLYLSTIWGSVCGPLLKKEETRIPEPIHPK